MTREDGMSYELSADRMTLTVHRPVSGGTRIITVSRLAGAGPFTDEDVETVLDGIPAVAKMQPGQRNRTRRRITRFGTVWTHLMTGPPTWRLPRFRIGKDGTVMIGWLRIAIAVKFERGKR